MIKINGLKKYYNNRLVLDIPEFSFQSEKIYSILGKNGAGKTTLLRILAGLLPCDEGYLETSIVDTILCTQEPRFFKGSVLYNLTEPFKLRGDSFDMGSINKLLEKFKITDLQDSEVTTLSSGEKAKVQFIRAVLYNKNILLLDEPTASIDNKSTYLIEEMIKEYKNRGCLIVIITHDYEQAIRVSDYIYEINEGKLTWRSI